MLPALLRAVGASSAAPAAACCCPAMRRAWASTSAASASPQQPAAAQQQDQQPAALDVAALTPEQAQHLRTLRFLVQRPLAAARDAALLTALAAAHRDLFAVADLLHKKDVLGIPRPLVDEPPASSSAEGEQEPQQPGGATQAAYPLRDLTRLPDKLPPEGGWLRGHLQERHMSRITAFAQLLPNHLEVSYQTGHLVFLWPPMEAFYPGFLDVENMLRYLQPHARMARSSRRRRRHKVRCSLGWARTKPHHKQRVFGTPALPHTLRVGLQQLQQQQQQQ